MPILDDPITFSIRGDSYKYASWVPGEGYVPREGVFGPEYDGVFTLRYRNFDDETAIQNKLRMRFPLGTQDVRSRHVDAMVSILTLTECRLGTGDRGGLPDWFDLKKLGSELDEAAVIHAFEKYRAELEAGKKGSAVPS